MLKGAKRKCLRYGRSKTGRRVCRSWGGKRGQRYCVYKGKKTVPESCHRNKRLAQKAYGRLKKKCKSKLRIKKKA